MQKIVFPPSFPYYLLALLFIAAWWGLAFFSFLEEKERDSVEETPQPLTLDYSKLLGALSEIKRERLKRALDGKLDEIVALTREWKEDKSKLKSEGIEEVENESMNNEEKILFLAQLLKEEKKERVKELNDSLSLSMIEDDSGKLLRPSKKKGEGRFLPQTYASATFLFALLPPTSFLSIPYGMKQLSHLYPDDYLKEIPGCRHLHSSEKLSLDSPKIAFLAAYSYPSTKKLLEKCGIPICYFNHENEEKKILATLRRMGHLVKQPLKAELMALFTAFGLASLDCRLKLLEKQIKGQGLSKKILFLNHHHHFSLPTSKSMTAILLNRVLKNSPSLAIRLPEEASRWSYPISREEISRAAPDHFIFILPSEEKKGGWRNQKMVRGLSVQRIDAAIQNSPTHYTLLAYFDLFHSLALAAL